MPREKTMTNKERIEALLRREKPDRVPTIMLTFQLFSELQGGGTLAEAFLNAPDKLDRMYNTCKEFDWIFIPYMAYGAFGAWEFGGEIKWPEGEFAFAPTVTRYPVSTPEEAMKLTRVDVKTAGYIPTLMELSKRSFPQKRDNKPWGALCYNYGPFSIAANICGPDLFVKWMIKKPEVCHHLLRLATDFGIDIAQYWKDTFGTEDVLMYGSEPTASNQLISPKHFKQFAFPYIKERQEKILDMGYTTTFWHICGEQNANLTYWAQIPWGDTGILSFGHEVTLETAAETFPNEIIMGNLEPAIMQTGTPEEIYEATKKNVEDGKKIGTGYIWGVGCSMPPGAGRDQVMAATRAVNDVGWYD